MKLKLILTTAIAAAGIGGFMADQASVASAAWTVTPTPVISGQRRACLGVDCSSANSCFAVGDVTAGTASPLDSAPIVEHWDGTSWQLMPTPTPSGSLARHLLPVAELLLRCRLGSAAGSSAGTGRAGRFSRARPPRAARSTTFPAPGSWPAPRSVPWARHAGPEPEHSHARRTLGRQRLARPVHPEPHRVGQQRAVQRLVSAETHVHGRRSVGRRAAWPRPSSSAGSGASTPGDSRPRRSPRRRRALGSAACPVRTAPGVLVVGSSATPRASPRVMAARRIGFGSWSIFPLTIPPRGASSQRWTARQPVLPGHRRLGEWPDRRALRRNELAGRGDPDKRAPSPFLADVSCPSRFFCMAVGDTASGPIGDTLAAKWTP